ncbi:DNA polymerase II large subunit [Candidatus Pyrohabitans sp.]
MEIDEYFCLLEERLREGLEIAQRARRLGFDPSLEVEIPLAKDMAERVEGLVGPQGVASRVRELCSEMSAEEAALTIAKEIVEGRFGGFDSREAAAEQALRTALAILTEGIVAAPLEGIVKVKIKKNADGGEYLAIYFAGPIRSAGGSAQALAVLVGDVIRQALGLERYVATEEEVERFVEEVDLYHHEAARLQYFPSASELRTAVRSLPVEVTGEPTEKVEVAGYRDLPRVETNQLRGGAVLVLAEGLLQKAPKVLKHVRRLGLEGWEWLAHLVSGKKQEKEEHPEAVSRVEPSFKYIKDLVAGRPVLSHPSAKGGFRLRYGRSRASGFASMAIHPATMVITGGFIAIGTQLKTERPGKGTAVTPCDTIEGPVVKLRDGSVVRVTSVEMAQEIKEQVGEILFLGDILVNYGDFLENNHPLAPAGYCEEWWVQELEQALKDEKGEKYRRFLDPAKVPSEEEALELSMKLGVPLHPRYTYFYHDVTKEDLKALAEWVFTGKIQDDALVLEMSPEKRVLELLCVPHRVVEGRVVLEEYRALLHCLGSSMERFSQAYERSRDAMELVNSFGVTVREKAPTYIGARMGRPEKAKERKMSPPVNVLFPIGHAGGKTRDVKKAAQAGKIRVEVAYRQCDNCGEVSIFSRCPRCGGETKLRRICSACGFVAGDERDSCPKCGGRLAHCSEREIELRKLLTRAERRVGSTPSDLKGVIGMTSSYKIPEALEKGILRSRNGVFVFKDGTSRFDATDVPVTHVRPREIGVSVEKMRELGYTRDYLGNPLESEEQLVELFPQDIILPESGAEYLLRVARFVDELLEEFYGLEPYYNANTKEDLLGHLVLGLAPHTSAAILGRIVGFSRASVGYAHPYFHAAKRRNCFHPEEKILVQGKGYLRFRELLNLCTAWRRDEAGTRIMIPKEKLFVTSFDPATGKVIKGEIKEVSVHSAPDHLIYLKTRSGKELRVTPDHRFPVFSEGKAVKKEARELKVGELLASPKEVECEEGLTRIDLLELLSGAEVEKDIMVRGLSREEILDILIKFSGEKEKYLSKASEKLGINKKTLFSYISRKSIPLWILKKIFGDKIKESLPDRIKLSVKRDKIAVNRIINDLSALGELLGFYAAEGYIRCKNRNFYQVSFASSDEELKERISELIRTVFGVESSGEGRWEVAISSRLIYWFFKIIGAGEDAQEKRIPGIIFSCGRDVRISFLKAYFEGDGFIAKDRYDIRSTTVSRDLALDIAMLLKSLGIACKVTSEKRKIRRGHVHEFYNRRGKEIEFNGYAIRISSENAHKFLSEIKFLSSRKKARVREVIENVPLRSAMAMADGGSVWLEEIVEKRIVAADAEFVVSLNVEPSHVVLVNDIFAYNCDGDEDSVFLMMDAFLNFSRYFLPATRGGTMDAPLVLTTRLDPGEVDSEAHNIDVVERYPLEFYEATLRFAKPQEFEGRIETVRQRLGGREAYCGLRFTHDTSDISAGVAVSAYKTLKEMVDKLEKQLSLAKKLRSVDERDVARRVIESHFLPDLAGNLRAFATQKVRCVNCNAKYRRVPLLGRCRRCGGKLVLTVARGSVEKYLKVTEELLERYSLEDYLRQRVKILRMSIESIFIDESVEQKSLKDYFG